MTIPYHRCVTCTWRSKYQLESVDETISDTFERVAKTLSDIEKPENRDEWYGKFLWALYNGAVPAGRIVSNAGAEQIKPIMSKLSPLSIFLYIIALNEHLEFTRFIP